MIMLWSKSNDVASQIVYVYAFKYWWKLSDFQLYADVSSYVAASEAKSNEVNQKNHYKIIMKL